MILQSLTNNNFSWKKRTKTLLLNFYNFHIKIKKIFYLIILSILLKIYLSKNHFWFKYKIIILSNN